MGNTKGSTHRIYPTVLVEALVRYKDGVPDPERSVILEGVQDRGYDLVTDATRAKYFRIKLANTTIRKARVDAREIGKILLANTIEQFEIIKIEATSP